MESWERILWSSAPGFPSRWLRPRTTYALTDLRVVRRRRDTIVHEIALQDIAAVRLEQRWHQRLFATSTVRVQSRSPRGRSIALSGVHHGPQLALILQLLAEDEGANARLITGGDFVERALSHDAPPLLRPNPVVVVVATALLAFTLAIAGIAQRETLAPITYAADDPIAPSGHRKSAEEISAFMWRSVMPFAQR